MYRKHAPKARVARPAEEPYAGNGMMVYLNKFLEWLAVMNYSPRTIEIRRNTLQRFVSWCDDRGLDKPQDINRKILESYQRYLHYYRKQNGEPLGHNTQCQRLEPVRAFFKWLARENHILYNPASELELPRQHKQLPRQILSIEEIERVMDQASLHGNIGIRDRAILELLYSTGLRRMEAVNLRLYDIDLENGTVMVRQGKGGKDRVVPLGERARAWLVNYLEEVRPGYLLQPDNDTVFLTEYGQPLVKNRLSDMVKKHLRAAGIRKRGACHLFRHSMATHMLENGADIRFIQAILGHSSLTTTEIYTRVSIHKLKEIHRATHPARL